MSMQCPCYLYANVDSARQGLANYYRTPISQVYACKGLGEGNEPSHTEERRMEQVGEEERQ